MTLQLQQILVRIAAAWNIFGGIIGILFPSLMFSMLYHHASVDDSTLLLHHRLLFGFIIIIGFGLLFASGNIHGNRVMLLVSASGKMFAAILWFLFIGSGDGKMMLAVSAGGDFGWSLLLIYLAIMAKPKNQKS